MQRKKWIAVALSGMLIFTVFPSPAYPNEHTGSGKYSAKDEVIYGNLSLNGTVENMYVVNTFHISEPGKIVDYGNYANIRNLTNLDEMKQSGRKIEFSAEEGEFYYQGELENKTLPWDISITYLLNGKEAKPEELAGKDGQLEIQIETAANEDVDEVFFENYLLQISLTFDPEKFNHLVAPEGTKANAGKNQQITFSVLPGQEEEFIVRADVTNLEMEPISINAVPANMSIDKPDLDEATGELETLADAIEAVSSGVSELTKGIDELSTGAAELGEGSTEYHNGMNELNHSSSQLVNGSASIQNALSQISESLQGEMDTPDLSELEQLPEGLRQLAAGIRESTGSMASLPKSFSQLFSGLDEAMAAIPDEEISLPNAEELTEEQLLALKELGIDLESIQQLSESYQAAQQFKASYQEMKEEIQAEIEKIEQPSAPVEELAASIESTADEIEKGLENAGDMDALEGLTQLQEGLETLSAEYGSFHEGLVKYTEGVSSLSSSYGELNSGIQALSEGAAALAEGAEQLEEGTSELERETNNLPNQVDEEVEKMLEEFDFSDFEPTSFVSEENDKIEIVQFVLQTEAIQIEEPETDDEQEDEEEKGFWQKLMDLFK